MYKYKNNNISVTYLQKDSLNRNRRQGKSNYYRISKGNKMKNLRKDKRKVMFPKKGEQQPVSVPEGSSNQLPLAKRCSPWLNWHI